MTCVNPSSNFPCPMCVRRARADYEGSEASGEPYRKIHERAMALIHRTTKPTPRERAEHLETVHGWRVKT